MAAPIIKICVNTKKDKHSHIVVVADTDTFNKTTTVEVTKPAGQFNAKNLLAGTTKVKVISIRLTSKADPPAAAAYRGLQSVPLPPLDQVTGDLTVTLTTDGMPVTTTQPDVVFLNDDETP